MTEKLKKRTINMLYTPNHHIPIGEVVKTPNGELGLCLKKDKETYEVLSIGWIVSQISNMASSIKNT